MRGRRPKSLAAAREALIEQLAYLLDEIEHLRPIIHRIPDPILEGKPLPESFSMKEIYGLIATLDEHVYLPRLHRIVAEDGPHLPALDARPLLAREPWDDLPIQDVLDHVQQARTELVGFLRALPLHEWDRTGILADGRRTVFDVAYGIIQSDTDHLRDLGYRLHESRMTIGKGERENE